MKQLLVALSLAVGISCGGNVPPVFPPTPPQSTTVSFDVVLCSATPAQDCPRVAGHVKVNLAPDTFLEQDTDAAGYTLFTVPASLANTYLEISAAGYQNLTVSPFQPAACINGCHNFEVLTAVAPPPPTFPAVPSRDTVLSSHMHFQGETVVTQQYGTLPWFEAALAWLDNPADRQAVYAMKHAEGDTGCIIQLPFGPPLYDEPGQPYSADRFGPRDWTSNLQQLNALVTEAIQNGFTPWIFLGGDNGEAGYVLATQQLPNVIASLKAGPVDLTQYVIVLPGWDGVFYGYTPPHIQAFSQQFRSLCPLCYLGIEHQPGRIPVGNGAGDYAPGGMMVGYDLILGEYNLGSTTPPLSQPSTVGSTPAALHKSHAEGLLLAPMGTTGYVGDQIWQVLGRMLNTFRRPPDMPAGDDPRPPFYLNHPSPRGPYYYNCFEWVGEYNWVRGKETKAQVDTDRAYLANAGCRLTG